MKPKEDVACRSNESKLLFETMRGRGVEVLLTYCGGSESEWNIGPRNGVTKGKRKLHYCVYCGLATGKQERVRLCHPMYNFPKACPFRIGNSSIFLVFGVGCAKLCCK